MHQVALSATRGAILLLAVAGFTLCFEASAQVADPVSPPSSLKDIAVPAIPNLSNYIRNNGVAIALGKALFWDQNAGSDGMACASCHFHAGADSRTKNQLHPGANGHWDAPVGAINWRANHSLAGTDFPLHALSDPLERNSNVISSITNTPIDDIVGSAGTFGGSEMRIVPRVGVACNNRDMGQDVFHIGDKLTRLTTGRNAPTVVNAVFNFRNFWDGRANNVFNGVNPFGLRDPNAFVSERQADGSERPARIALINSSLASQAVGPALNTVEMTCALKGFKELGRKLYSLRPLKDQQVHKDDSVLKTYRAATGAGLTSTYATLIKAAFDAKYWSSTKVDVEGYTQFERNFSLFWGLAIQAYEATLISDETPYDKYVGDRKTHAEANALALTEQQTRGLKVFMGDKANCIACHKGAEFTGAATLLQAERSEEGLIERMIMGDSTAALYDNSFYNIGVTPTANDLGVGGNDPFGNPLSFTRQYKNASFPPLGQSIEPDHFQINPCSFKIPVNVDDCQQTPFIGSRIATDGAFKTPTLRNITLTAPYFHNGGKGTLEQVVEFYNRGGDRRGEDGQDSTGQGANGSNLDADIRFIGLTDQEKADLVAFLRYGLTDRRVACEMGPFDHPSLKVPHGHKGDESLAYDANNDGKADDDWLNLPAVGKYGLPGNGSPCYANDVGEQLSAVTDGSTLLARSFDGPALFLFGIGAARVGYQRKQSAMRNTIE
jgi:cytochrome c peroxidase